MKKDQNIIDEINSFAFLEEEWAYGDGVSATDKTVKLALYIHSLNEEFDLNVEAFPSIDGGISLSFSKDKYFLDIDIMPDLRIDVRHETGIGKEYTVDFTKSDVTIQAVNALLTELKEYK